MKKFKPIDFYLQAILVLFIVVTLLINEPEKANPIIFVVAFALLQIISILLHFFTGPQTWKKSTWRKYHLIGTGLILALLVIALFQGSSGRSHDKDDKYSMAGLEIVVWVTIPAILLSLFYIIITWQEWKSIQLRELTQLK